MSQELVSAVDSGVALLLSDDFQASLWSGIALLAIGAATKVFNPRPKVVWGTNHQFVLGLAPAANAPAGEVPLNVFTRTINVMNEGGAPASGVEVHFTARPGHYQLWPTFEHETAVLTDGGFIIRVPGLGIREGFSVELLQTGTVLPDVMRVRSSRGEAPCVALAPMRVLSNSQLWIVRVLLVLGAYTVLRWLAAFVIAALN